MAVGRQEPVVGINIYLSKKDVTKTVEKTP